MQKEERRYRILTEEEKRKLEENIPGNIPDEPVVIMNGKENFLISNNNEVNISLDCSDNKDYKKIVVEKDKEIKILKEQIKDIKEGKGE